MGWGATKKATGSRSQDYKPGSVVDKKAEPRHPEVFLLSKKEDLKDEESRSKYDMKVKNAEAVREFFL
jgi:hypothetical protein